jgi:hypothetical protein
MQALTRCSFKASKFAATGIGVMALRRILPRDNQHENARQSG